MKTLTEIEDIFYENYELVDRYHHYYNELNFEYKKHSNLKDVIDGLLMRIIHLEYKIEQLEER